MDWSKDRFTATTTPANPGGALRPVRGPARAGPVASSPHPPCLDPRGLRAPLTVFGNRFHQGGGACLLKGVTYGTFRRRTHDQAPYPPADTIAADLGRMLEHGVNAVRLYTPPPPDMLEIADDLGIGLFVGLDRPDLQVDPPTTRRARIRLRDAGRRAATELADRCSGHPSVIAASVGNELPVAVVRLIGPRAVEELLADRAATLHAALPGVPVTYVNFPTTEFLEPEGLDFLSFNVFLEARSDLRRYLHHLAALAQGRPLVVSELGLASRLHGEDAQATALRSQLETLTEAGCAGGFVFGWTDDWAVGDVPVRGWGFGLTRPDRTAKPALRAVEAWTRSDGTRALRTAWPRISVVVCAYNEERTIEECLAAACALDYPDFEVIVCDDGSTDRTVELARRFPVRLLELPHGGLSNARNAGWRQATGDIVAYLDADAYPDPEWLLHLALSFEGGAAASGGFNLPVEDAALMERAVAASPGSPREVLLAADAAEHVPGCTLAVRRQVLADLGGFQPLYTTAGDDVDLCWRIQDRGLAIGFAPAALVFHHRRSTLRGYLRQQRGYGRAERLLTAQHAHRFNRLGQPVWTGFVYGSGRLLPGWIRPLVYTGWAGSAPFQPIARRRAELAVSRAGAALPLLLLAGLSTAPLAPFRPGLGLVPLLAVLAAVAYGAAVGVSAPVSHREPEPVKLRCLVGVLHVLQPLARAWGRMGIRCGGEQPPLSDWTGDRMAWLSDLRRRLHAARGVRAELGGSGAPWDVAVRRWGFVTAWVTTATLWGWEPRWRVRVRPRPAPTMGQIAALAVAVDERSAALGVVVLALTLATGVDWFRTRRTVVRTLRKTAAAAGNHHPPPADG